MSSLWEQRAVTFLKTEVPSTYWIGRYVDLGSIWVKSVSEPKDGTREILCIVLTAFPLWKTQQRFLWYVVSILHSQITKWLSAKTNIFNCLREKNILSWTEEELAYSLGWSSSELFWWEAVWVLEGMSMSWAASEYMCLPVQCLRMWSFII
jgi:hypothetical protein